MVIVDSADNLRSETWSIRDIIPQGQGSLVVTSRDRKASEQFREGSEVVEIECMHDDEAKALLWTRIGGSHSNKPAGKTALDKWLGVVVGYLNAFPLALDLAGANIKDDMRVSSSKAEYDFGGEDAVPLELARLADFALQKYIRRFQTCRTSMLKREDYASTSDYQKPLWTVWTTTLTALEMFEQRNEDLHSLKLLRMLAMSYTFPFQKEMFRLASKVSEGRRHFKAALPQWLVCMIKRTQDGQWDDYSYAESIEVLCRFGLVQRKRGSFPGVTMHGLISWRARQESTEEARRWYLDFILTTFGSLLGEPTRAFKDHFPDHVVSSLVLAKEPLGIEHDRETCDSLSLFFRYGSISRKSFPWGCREIQRAYGETTTKSDECTDSFHHVVGFMRSDRSRARYVGPAETCSSSIHSPSAGFSHFQPRCYTMSLTDNAYSRGARPLPGSGRPYHADDPASRSGIPGELTGSSCKTSLLQLPTSPASPGRVRKAGGRARENRQENPWQPA